MKAKINKDLIASLKPKDKPYEIYDMELKGFTLRVQPSGVMTYLVRYRWAGEQKRVRVGKHQVNTPAQARDEARRVLAGLLHGINPIEKETVHRTEHTLKSFIEEEYSKEIEANRKDGIATIARLKSCFIDKYGKFLLTDIDQRTIEQWRTERILDGKSQATVNRDITALKSMFTKALEWGHVSVHPLLKVKPAKVDSSGRVRYLSGDEEKRLLNALDERENKARTGRAAANKWRAERGYPLYQDLNVVTFTDHLKPLVLISLNTGVRWGELTSLTWNRVNFEMAQLTVIGDNSKSGQTRHVPLNTIALNALKEWQKQSNGSSQNTAKAQSLNKTDGTKSKSSSMVAGDVVFPGRDGNTLDNVYKSWGAVLGVAAIKNFRWHDMRHHFASWLVMAGVDLNTVRELLGHADLKMTLRYAHLAPEHKALAVAQLVR